MSVGFPDRKRQRKTAPEFKPQNKKQKTDSWSATSTNVKNTQSVNKTKSQYISSSSASTPTAFILPNSPDRAQEIMITPNTSELLNSSTEGSPTKTIIANATNGIMKNISLNKSPGASVTSAKMANGVKARIEKPAPKEPPTMASKALRLQ